MERLSIYCTDRHHGIRPPEVRIGLSVHQEYVGLIGELLFMCRPNRLFPMDVLHCLTWEPKGAPMSIVKLVTEERLPILLRSVGPEREAAAEELRALLVRAALAYLLRQHYPVEAFGADTYASIAEDYAQEAFTIILRQLNRFRGECRFTTWAYRIVINLIADEMRRRC